MIKRAQSSQFQAVFFGQPIHFLDPIHLNIATQRVILELAFQRQQRRFRQTSVGGAGRQPNIETKINRARQRNFPRFDHQHVGAFGRVVLGDVGRTCHIAHDCARFELFDVDDFGVERGCCGHDQIGATDVFIGVGGDSHPRMGRFFFDQLLECQQFFGSRRNTNHIANRLRQQPSAHRANRASRADHHGGAFVHAPAHQLHGLFGCFQRRRHRQRIARRDTDGGFLRHRNARIADDRGERAQTHQFCAHSLGHSRRFDQAPIGETGRAAHQLTRCSAQRQQNTLDFLARAFGFDARHPRQIHRRHGGGDALDQRLREIFEDFEARIVVDKARGQRVNHKGELVHFLVFGQALHGWVPLRIGDDG